jgi:parvulin-like peptidyl-prolyl isomerase
MKPHLAAVAAALLLSACGDALAPPAAVVSGHRISTSSVSKALDRFKESPSYSQAAQQSGGGVISRQFEQAYLARLIRHDVLTVRARQMGIVVTTAEVQRALTQIKSNFSNEAAFRKALQQQGLTQGDLVPLVRDRVLEQRLRTKVISEIAPSTQEMRSFYRQHLSRYRRSLVSHILVASPVVARRLSDRLQGKSSSEVAPLFASLARRVSTDQTSAAKGGALGPLVPGSSSFARPFQKAAEALKPGEVSDPVHTKFGWHVIFVRKELVSFAKVRDQIAQQLAGPQQDRQWRRWLVAAYKASRIKVNPSYGMLDLQTQTILDEPNDFPGAPAPSHAAPSSSPAAPSPAG